MKISALAIVAMVTTGVLSPLTYAQQAPKEIHFATEGSFLPWNKTNPDGSVGGFEIDLMKNLCQRMDVKCTFSEQSFDAMIPALNQGKYDALVDAIGITKSREKQIAFSKPYASLCYNFATMKNNDVVKTFPKEDKTIVISGKEDPLIARVKKALKGEIIGSMASGTSTRFINTYLADTSKVKVYKTPDTRNIDLKIGRVDVILASKDSLMALKKKPKYSHLALIGPCMQGGVLGSGQVGVGLRKDSTQLKAMLDKAITAALADGTVKKMSEKTFGVDMSPNQ